MLWPLTPRSRATSVTFLPDAIRSRTRRLNSGGYLPAMPTSSWGHGHDESNDAAPQKWGNINASTGAGQDQTSMGETLERSSAWAKNRRAASAFLRGDRKTSMGTVA